MKSRILVMLAILCVAITCCSAFSSPVMASPSSASVSSASQQPEILATRFLNMLNHSSVYGADFEDAAIMAEKSIYSLLSLRQGDYISCSAVSSFVNDMYGVEIIDISDSSNEGHQKGGYIYISPCGFTSYKHTDADICRNEDGSYTVTTSVTVQPHDGDAYSTVCTSLFVKNTNSSFGFNIISSDIILNAEAYCI